MFPVRSLELDPYETSAIPERDISLATDAGEWEGKLLPAEFVETLLELAVNCAEARVRGVAIDADDLAAIELLADVPAPFNTLRSFYHELANGDAKEIPTLLPAALRAKFEKVLQPYGL